MRNSVFCYRLLWVAGNDIEKKNAYLVLPLIPNVKLYDNGVYKNNFFKTLYLTILQLLSNKINKPSRAFQWSEIFIISFS